MGVVASSRAPGIFLQTRSRPLAPVNDGDYEGGFTEQQVTELLEILDSNHMGWSQAMAPDHGQFGSTGIWGRADEQLLQDRSCSGYGLV
jgi:hypothetical protein